MGLLDMLGSSVDDPKTAATLALAQGLLTGRSGMTGLLGGAQGYIGTMAAAKQQEEARKQEALKMQLLQAQTLHAQQQAEVQAQMIAKQKAIDAAAKGAMVMPQLPSMMTGSGERSPQDNQALQTAIGNVKPQFDRAKYAQALFGIDPGEAIKFEAATAKDDAPVKLAPGEQLFSGKASGYKPLASAAPKDDKPAPVKEYEYAKLQGYPGTFQQFVLDQKRAGATTVALSMDKGFGTTFADNAAKDLSASRDKARAAVSTINTLDNIDRLIDTGKVATGPTQPFQTFGMQLAQGLNIGGKDNAEKLANTRNLIQSAANLALDGAARMAGQGQITEGERQLIKDAAGGGIDRMTPPEIKALTSALRKVNSGVIAGHQSLLQNVGPEFQKFTPFYKVDMPATPTNVDDLLKKYGG